MIREDGFMVRMYRKIIERHLSEVELEKLKADTEALKPLVEEIFKEDCQIYIYLQKMN